ncbi:MAG: ATP-binding cassette domain-containing protein [Candidatus Methanomethylicaceae archaeon]
MEEYRKVILEVRGLCKFFGAVKAVNNIDLKIYEREIVGIVGDNGAGKSTLIKVLSGVYRKTAGQIFVWGQEVDIQNPGDARKLGIETVYQDQGLIPIFDAASNLFLGREKLREDFWGKLFKIVDDRFMLQETSGVLSSLGIDIKDARLKVLHLSGGQRQVIAIGRAMYWRGKILIFDEPTNNLGVKQERKVLELIKRIRDELGASIIVISHNIAHIFEVVDRIIVLRNGEKVGERLKEETSPAEIVAMITGVNI